MTNFSAEHLIKCISEKDGKKYKQTTAYIKQIEAQNQSIYQIVNQALYSILVGVKYPYMSKFFALRFYRDLFLSAQFQLIDGLDQNIIKQIVKASQFNKQVKQKNRGANYFIEVQKRKKDGEIQKIGNSYVLLATEIVYVSALWYPVDQNNQKTQYAVIYQKLLKMDVPFPTNQKELVFFKQQDKNIFQKNYKNWLQKLPQINQDEEEETQKNSNSNKNILNDIPLNVCESQKGPQQKKNQIQSIKAETNALINSNIRISENSVRIQIPTQHQKQNSQKSLNKVNKNLSQSITKKKLNSYQDSSKQNEYQKIILQNKKLKNQFQEFKKQKNEEIIKLKKQFEEISKSELQKNLAIQKYSQEIQKEKKQKQNNRDKDLLQIEQKNKQIQNLTKKLKQIQQIFQQEKQTYQKCLKKCNIQEIKIKKIEKELKEKTNQCQEKAQQVDKLIKCKQNISNIQKMNQNSTEGLNQINNENKQKYEKVLQINKKYKKQIQTKDQQIESLSLKTKVLNEQVAQYKQIVQRITLQNKNLQQRLTSMSNNKNIQQKQKISQKQSQNYSQFCQQKQSMQITMSQYLSKLKKSTFQNNKPLITNNIRQIYSIGKTQKSLQKRKTKILREQSKTGFNLRQSQSALRYRYNSSHNLYNSFNDCSFLKLTSGNKRNQNQFYRTHSGLLCQDQLKTTNNFLNKSNNYNKIQSNRKSIKINRKSSTTIHEHIN